jgi:GNAT superfamily N-acetyltransferase
MLTAAPEPWATLIEEMKPMLPIITKSSRLIRTAFPLSPQYHVYDERDAQGMVMAIALRDAGELVGYFIGFVAPGLHYSTCLTLQLDIFWIHPDHRGQKGGFMLFKAVEAEAKRRGVQRMFVGSKTHLDASFLFEKLGYTKVETVYSAMLEDL